MSSENYWALSNKVKDMHTYDLASPFLDLHPTQMHVLVPKEVCGRIYKQYGFQ